MVDSLTAFDTLDGLGDAAAEVILECARLAIAEHGRFVIALSGGSSPHATYERLARESDAIDWSKVFVFFSDERGVEPDSPLSNYGRAHSTLLSKLPLDEDHICRIHGELEPADAVRRFEEHMRRAFAPRPEHTFDLVLLGMGADGHTASLFPGDPILEVDDAWAAAVSAPEGTEPRRRITLTLPVIAASREVLFIVVGADKREVWQQIQSGTPGSEAYPAARVRAAGRVRWLVAPR